MRGYIAGPMAGFPDFNYRAFYGAEAALDLGGWRVVNPARLDAHGVEDFGVDYEALTVTASSRAAFLKRDFEWLVRCDAIFMLPGWESSKGANAELLVARMTGMEVFVLEWDHVEEWWVWFPAPRLAAWSGLVREHLTEVQNESDWGTA